jgi:hypothetical protein
MRLIRLALLIGFSCLVPAIASAQAPRAFFTDLDSGPNAGGETVSGFSGAYVTLYGNFFGATQGTSTITWNGLSCLRVVNWGQAYLWYQRTVVQLGPSCTAGTGNFVVTTSLGASNGIPFTVRSGTIYFVTTTGSDSAAGTFAAPWRTPLKAKNTMVAGDITYIRTGTYGGIDNFGATLSINGKEGTAGNNIAMVGYPGELPMLDGGNQDYSFRCNYSTCRFWTIANLSMPNAHDRGVYWQESPSDGMRLVANKIYNSDHENVVFEGLLTNHKIYGNEMYNPDHVGPSAKGYSIYWGAYGIQDGIDFGWNSLHFDLPGSYESKGMQFYGHKNGDRFRNVVIHDNMFANFCMEAIVMGGTDAPDGQGPFESTNTQLLYNNIFIRNGFCDPNYGYSGVKFSSGGYRLYNNTFYRNGDSPRVSPSGDIDNQGVAGLVVTNNILVAPTPNSTYCGYVCYEYGGTAAQLSGSNDLFLNFGNGPSWVVSPINSQDPKFVNPTISLLTADFHLQSTSPAIGAGTGALYATTDITGVVRPTPPAVGAYEISSGSPAVGLSPASLAFSSQTINTTSGPKSVTLTNTGTASLTIVSISITGTNPADFVIASNGCGTSLAALASCNINVTFTPLSPILRAANLSVTSNATTSPNTVPLTGTGLVSMTTGGVSITGGAAITTHP